jgi:cyclic pyranopterin phosphate synthase
MENPQLIDKFGRKHEYLRISLTDACNLRCTYCMPNEKVSVTPSSKLMSCDEIREISQIFVDFGIKKIRLTGGEPLVRKDFAEIVKQLSTLDVKLSLTTNAVLIDQYISVLKENNVNSINVSLDSLNEEEFFQMTKRGDFQKVLSNIYLLLKNDFKVKVNVVILKGINEHVVDDFINWTEKFDIEVRFIEFMPFSGNDWQKNQVVPYKEMLREIENNYSVVKIEDDKNDTAKHYQVAGFKGKFAFITTISEPFCDSCNRLRLTADGKMKNCLFSSGEMNLLAPFRAGEDIRDLILQNVLDKKKERGGQFSDDDILNIKTSLSACVISVLLP